MDTAAKRFSAVNYAAPWRGIGALPDGTIGAPDRLALAFLYSGIAAGEYVEPPAPPPSDKGAGKSRKPRRKVVVEIDGQEIYVDSEDAALALLDEVRETAKQEAEKAIQRATKAERRPVRKILADTRKALEPPEIKAPDYLADAVAEVMAQIAQIREDTLRTVEIEALLKRRQREQDEEDEELLLLML